MMPDDSIRPLDDFFVPYGLATPPYLEDMPEELQLGSFKDLPSISKRGRRMS